MSIHARIAELGITLPEPAKPVASYVSYVRTGSQILISGQLSNDANGGIKGTVGVGPLNTSVNCGPWWQVAHPASFWNSCLPRLAACLSKLPFGGSGVRRLN